MTLYFHSLSLTGGEGTKGIEPVTQATSRNRFHVSVFAAFHTTLRPSPIAATAPWL